MVRVSMLYMGGVVLGVASACALAEPPRIVGPQVKEVAITSNHGTSVRLVTREVAYPAATVSRELSEQPVRPHMVEVRLTGAMPTTTYLDPQASFRRLDGAAGLDDGHSLVKAVLLWKSLNSDRDAKIVWGSAAARPRTDQAIQPRFIIIRPDLPDQQPQPKANPIPTVPGATPKPDGAQVAAAD